MRRTLVILALTLVALIGGLGLWGVTLPRDHRATSRVTLTAPPESVYNVMRDLGSLPAWWKDAKTVTPVPGNDGWERWREEMDGFEMTVVVAEEEPAIRFVTRIETGPDAPFGGTWTYATTLASGGGTMVTLTEEGWVADPFFRVMMKLSGPHTTIDSYLAALGTRFGQTVTPAH